ncbi:MAG: peptidase [Flavobacteriales bacterium CG_4_9_14_3_um_filter_40_17]|nr:MAG: peptidase [Flavobacteriales bacterium CG_4_9_14_3_um_filter_40_17]
MLKKTLALLIVMGSTFVSAQFLAQKKNLQKFEGFFNAYYNGDTDELYLEVNHLDAEFLYVYSLRTGLGSNEIGLDRGKLGQGKVVKFVKAGNKLLLVEPNLKYRAITDNQAEKKSVEEAFARSVLFGFEIKEKKGDSYIIDFTPFLMHDAYGVAGTLKNAKQGNFSFDKSRSALSLERTKSFPKNSEFEALITLTGSDAGARLKSVSPDDEHVSVIQHHSFVELPDGQYKPRVYDPRSGSYPFSYMDYSTPISSDITKRFIMRHRLAKKDPNAAVSDAVEPIVYYLDPGTPEPVRSALLEGASWWNQAFEATGYRNAFQVEMLPEDADPMDVRYNLIQWVHRSTRGWSYGGSISDPRTGEIIKGHVSLGSLRIRQDYLIAQALIAPFAESDSNTNPMLQMALARIRQLSAHEVGHTLGFAHNFAASTNNLASVMDYPHPFVDLQKGQLSIKKAYDTGIGEWDKVVVAYAYSEFPPNVNEQQALKKILDDSFKSGLRYITDQDARPEGGAHALAHLWDNGTNAAVELTRMLQIRKVAIDQFSTANIRTYEPYSVLEDVFVPLYYFHRYQAEAASKIIGGLDYNYAIKGDGEPVWQSVSPEQQREALNALVLSVSPETLAIPKNILELFPPRAFGYGRSRESFKSKTGVAFDALGAAASASDMVFGLLFHPQRASRMIQQKALDDNQLGLDELVEVLFANTFDKQWNDAYLNEIQQIINFSLLDNLMHLGAADNVHPQVKAIINDKLNKLLRRFQFQGLASQQKKGKKEERSWPSNAFTAEYARLILDFQKDAEPWKKQTPSDLPDGSPIGSFQCLLDAF